MWWSVNSERRQGTLIGMLCVGLLAASLNAACAQTEPQRGQAVQYIPAEWIAPMNVALSDFRERNPDTWSCFTTQVQKQEDSWRVSFVSPPVIGELGGGEIQITAGEGQSCGSRGMTYVVNARSEIVERISHR